MKKIIINDVEYDVCCNAWTRVLYKKIFKRGIFEDLGITQKFALELDKAKTEEDKNAIAFSMIDDVLDQILNITYIEILSANPNFMEYEEWLKTLTNINLSESWITEVMEIASDCFRG